MTTPDVATIPVGTPASLLGMGTSGGWWGLGLGLRTGAVHHSYAELAAGFSAPPYFLPTAGNTAVQFQVDMDGGVFAPGEHYPRTELREFCSDGVSRAAWDVSGTHLLSYSFRVNHVQPNRPEVIIGQVSDAAGRTAVSVRVTGTAGGHSGFLAQWFVANTGDDANSGTAKTAPKKTIAAALSVAGPGDVISVAPGIYLGNLVSTRGGTADGVITIRSEIPYRAVISGDGLTETEAAVEINHSYLRIQDFTITGADGSGLRTGVLVRADHVEVVGNDIRHVCQWETGGTGWEFGAGISVEAEEGVRTGITLDANMIHDIGLAASTEQFVYGIHLPVHTASGVVTNNLIYACEDWAVHCPDTGSGWELINNTVAGCGRGILQSMGGITRNNICYDNIADDYDIRGAGNVLSNNFSGGDGTVVGVPGVISGINPLFVNGVTDGTGDFRLQAGSPAVDAGTAAEAPRTDLVGTLRPRGAAVDIGAYESLTGGGLFDVVAAVYGVDLTPAVLTGYSLGDAASVTIAVDAGLVTVSSSGVPMATSAALTDRGAGHAFRLGVYPQSRFDHGGFEITAEYCSVDIWGLTVAHSPPL